MKASSANLSGSYIRGGDNFGPFIHCPVNLAGKLGARFALADQRGVRVGGGKVSPIELAVAFIVFGQFIKPGLEFVIVSVELAFQGVHIYDGIV